MGIESFSRGDIAQFLQLAMQENWIAEEWELGFLLENYPQGCFVERSAGGVGIGFITALRHQRSGWIGNLVVLPQRRREGVGCRLFSTALEMLRGDGVETVWLTASSSGQALYEKYGFSCIDTIIRWSGSGLQQNASQSLKKGGNRPEQSVFDIDLNAWGDRRESLLAATVDRGELLRSGQGFGVIQPWGSVRQIGPFAAPDAETAGALLDAALRSVSTGTRVLLDAPASNRAALELFNKYGMKVAGRCALMYAGQRPDYRPEFLYGLATMGSCG